MSYNPNKSIDTDVCRAIEKLYDALRRKGVTLRGVELSKPLVLFGTDMEKVTLDVGTGFNRRHIRVSAPNNKQSGGKG